jgi:hypothetical protein
MILFLCTILRHDSVKVNIIKEGMQLDMIASHLMLTNDF